MRIDILLHNLDLLWNYPDAPYFVGADEKLHRNITVFRGNALSVARAVQHTLEAASAELRNNNKIYITSCGKGFSSHFVDPIRLYSAKFPAYLVAERVLQQQAFAQVAAIQRAAGDLLACVDLYPDSKVPDGVLRGMDNPKVLHWDEAPT